MPDFLTFCLLGGVLLQCAMWARRARASCAVGNVAVSILMTGVLLVLVYAWHDADFTLFFGQLFLTVACLPLFLRPVCGTAGRHAGNTR